MNTSVVNVKVDTQVKQKAQEIAEELGLSISALVNGYLRQLIKTKTVHFSAIEEEPSDYLIQSLKEAEEDIKAGRVSPGFDNVKDAIAWLRDPKARYANQIRQKV